ncbi:MAG: pyrroline-5-carboxylate reductase [Roseovarius sp.]|nr:pyrroline-5-carboxylate reductase [Roseovarius sp.]MCY4207887.1 pyrroline-5-carboxylate reductase [Roseovarius sp.]MCY4291985.1 pyrroline-5-carboxylate reductase [Roseovarius sp.]MCY4315656.1 pyrroline-5-carboxylate reductase [Roseovarius sp.]
MGCLNEASITRLALLGCGKIGSALLRGWLEGGMRPECVNVLEPQPSEWLQSTGVKINSEQKICPDVVVIAVKPQLMDEALPLIRHFGGGGTLFISVAAGTQISAFEKAFGFESPVIRAMPNTPAAVRHAITAIIGNKVVGNSHYEMARSLLGAVGKVVRLDHEDQMDAVTGLSGSGPAYVFHMVECLAAAGVEQGLSSDLAMQLAKATVAGAGALVESSSETPAELRSNVTSKNGTTAAGLDVLMNNNVGMRELISKTVAAASNRSKELRCGR